MVKTVPMPPGIEVTMARPKPRRVLQFQRILIIFLCCIVVAQTLRFLTFQAAFFQRKDTASHRRNELRTLCNSIRTPAGPPQSFNTAARTENDRFAPGTPPVLLRNATIWTGASNGTEIVSGDVLLDRGLVVAVGYIPPSLLDGVRQSSETEIRVEDVGGAWVTPGLVDLHSHLGVGSAPSLSGKSCYHPLQHSIFAINDCFSRCVRHQFPQGAYSPMASKYRWFKHPRCSVRVGSSRRGNYRPDSSRKCQQYW